MKSWYVAAEEFELGVLVVKMRNLCVNC